jgi:hypothetical protein
MRASIRRWYWLLAIPVGIAGVLIMLTHQEVCYSNVPACTPVNWPLFGAGLVMYLASAGVLIWRLACA